MARRSGRVFEVRQPERVLALGAGSPRGTGGCKVRACPRAEREAALFPPAPRRSWPPARPLAAGEVPLSRSRPVLHTGGRFGVAAGSASPQQSLDELPGPTSPLPQSEGPSLQITSRFQPTFEVSLSYHLGYCKVASTKREKFAALLKIAVYVFTFKSCFKTFL